MNKRGVFNSENYNTFMYVGISVTILLIFFNFVNIASNAAGEENNLEVRNVVTGYAIDEEVAESGEFSMAHTIYYGFVLLLVGLIFGVIFYVIKVVKKD